jgi:ribosomal protein S18 acetylase RimI-like enzyme
MTPPVVTASRVEQEHVVSVITLAFVADPVTRWALADPAEYLGHMPAVVDALGGFALDHATAYCIEGYLGAALWLPPGAHPDLEALGALVERTVPEPKRKFLFEVFDQMGSYHPAEPHWYLRLIGIGPSWQNRGLGSLLMQHAHAILDRDGTLAYLESSNPRNVPFYQRHGYKSLGTIRVGTCPPISPMLREPGAKGSAR